MTTEGHIAALERRHRELERQIDDEEMKNLVGYLDRLLEALPADRISEFAASEYYQLYIKLLERLGI